LSVLMWGTIIALFTIGGRWAWLRLDSRLAGQVPDSRGLALVLLSFASALLPAGLAPVSTGVSPVSTEPDSEERPSATGWRPGVLSLVLAGTLVAGMHLVGPAGTVDLGHTVSAATRWTQQHWLRLETAISDKVDQFYIRLYDRRAPLQATPTPQPAGAPAARQPGAETRQGER